jgi:hypothetical protein
MMGMVDTGLHMGENAEQQFLWKFSFQRLAALTKSESFE